jgi:hypothetical protein
MIPKYIPILKAKKGEFDAFSNLPMNVKKQVLPLFELPQFSSKSRETKAYRDKSNPVECFVNNTANKINEAVGQSPVMVDIFRWAPNATLESGEHLLGHLSSRLTSAGCSVIPVIGYERWEDEEYSSVLVGMANHYQQFCLRLESYAFEDMIEEEHFIECLEDIIDSMCLDASRTSVILDFGDATKMAIVDMEEKVSAALSLLRPYGFKYMSIAGCSVAGVINDMVPDINSTGFVVRKEVMVWKSVRRFNPEANFIFGDYGIANPNVGDDIIAPDANGKIRYTIADKYFVIRGYSRRQGEKGAQMYDLSRNLIESPHYLGSSFSWGDSRIQSCSNEEFKGNPTQWISIDTNHHVTYALTEVKEFERGLVTVEDRVLVGG